MRPAHWKGPVRGFECTTWAERSRLGSNSAWAPWKQSWIYETRASFAGSSCASWPGPICGPQSPTSSSHGARSSCPVSRPTCSSRVAWERDDTSLCRSVAWCSSWTDPTRPDSNTATYRESPMRRLRAKWAIACPWRNAYPSLTWVSIWQTRSSGKQPESRRIPRRRIILQNQTPFSCMCIAIRLISLLIIFLFDKSALL